MLKKWWIIPAARVVFALPVRAHEAMPLGPMQTVLEEQAELIVKNSRTTIGPEIDVVAVSGLAQAQGVLETWRAREMWQRKEDGLFFRGEETVSKTYRLIDFETGEAVAEHALCDLKQIKPNSGIRTPRARRWSPSGSMTPTPARGSPP